MLRSGGNPLPELDLTCAVRDSSVRGLGGDIEEIVELILGGGGQPVVTKVGTCPVCKEHGDAKAWNGCDK